jgi:hypothetical protein
MSPRRNDITPQDERQQIPPALVGIKEIMVSIIEIRNAAGKVFDTILI